MSDLEQARQRFFEALEHHNAGRFGEAERLYREAARLAPERVSVAVNLAAVLVSQGHFQDGLAWSERALQLEPGNREASHSRALCQRMLAQGNGSDGNDPLMLEQRATLLEARQDISGALAAWAALLALQPQHGHGRVRLAGLLLQAGRVDEGIRAFHALLCGSEPAPAGAGEHFCRLMLQQRLLPQGEQQRFEQLLAGALLAPWHRPAELAAPVLRQLRGHPQFAAGLAAPVATEPALLHEPLLHALLASTVLADVQLERLLQRTRSMLLARVALNPGTALAPKSLELLVALALQCHLNEYVWPLGAADPAYVDDLSGRLRRAVASGHVPPAAWVAAVASCRDLHEVLERPAALACSWPPSVERIVARQLRERAREAELGAALPQLTALDDDISQSVRAMYESNPYPRWIGTPRDRRTLTLAEYVAHRLGRSGVCGSVEAQPRALVAGCGTGQQPLELALLVPQLAVLAIDLSRASLACAARQAEVHGVDRIRFAQADLLELGGLPQRFELIEACGVLHHLQQPERGLAVLRGLLAPAGLLRLALYSERGRSAVVAARALAAAEGYAADGAGIRRFRQHILALPADHPARGIVEIADFHSTSECRDLVFHVHERRFTLPELAALLQAQDLEFLGFELTPPVLQRFQRSYPAPAALRDLQAWDAYERYFPETFAAMYSFWARPRA